MLYLFGTPAIWWLVIPAVFWGLWSLLVRPALMVAILFRTLDALRMYDLPVIMESPATIAVTSFSKSSSAPT